MDWLITCRGYPFNCFSVFLFQFRRNEIGAFKGDKSIDDTLELFCYHDFCCLFDLE